MKSFRDVLLSLEPGQEIKIECIGTNEQQDLHVTLRHRVGPGHHDVVGVEAFYEIAQ